MPSHFLPFEVKSTSHFLVIVIRAARIAQLIRFPAPDLAAIISQFGKDPAPLPPMKRPPDRQSFIKNELTAPTS
jgi:hypothetical protein